MKGGQGGSEEDRGCRERREGEREGREGGEGGEGVIDGFNSRSRFQSKKYGRRRPSQ